MAQGEKEQSGAQNRSKSVAWNEPLRLFLFQRINRRKKGKEESKNFRQMDGELNSRRPSKWTHFCTKVGFHRGNNLHAEREVQGGFFRAGPERMNYDSQNYALNFSADERDSPASTSPQMPIISGPRAREIVTVLLTRNATIVIPKPIILDVKQETNSPLWMRRGVSTPAPLHIRTG